MTKLMDYMLLVNKRRSLLEGIYNLNRHADKRCYYLHFTDGDQDTLIWCAKGFTQKWGGREGASQAPKLGYQVALTVTTFPHCTHCQPRAAGFPSAHRRGSTWQAASCRAAPPRVLPPRLISAQRRQVPVYPGSICYWLAPQKMFWIRLADVLAHIWRLLFCCNTMIWKLFALDVYSSCWFNSSASFKPFRSPEFLPEFIVGKWRL